MCIISKFNRVLANDGYNHNNFSTEFVIDTRNNDINLPADSGGKH